MIANSTGAASTRMNPAVKREAEEDVLDFCEQQLAIFDARAWQRFDGVEPAELAAVALFLAEGPAHDRRAELQQIAERLHPGSVGRLASLVASTDFEPARFAAMLRARLQHARTS